MNEKGNLGEKRVLETSEKKGLQIRDLILVAVLLAAGAVLKFFVGSLINIGGMKPNFIIAMYCMAIALINANVASAAVIGILAGAINNKTAIRSNTRIDSGFLLAFAYKLFTDFCYFLSSCE